MYQVEEGFSFGQLILSLRVCMSRLIRFFLPNHRPPRDVLARMMHSDTSACEGAPGNLLKFATISGVMRNNIWAML